MKLKWFITFALLISVITATSSITYYILQKPKTPTKIIHLTSNPEDDVQVGRIALEKIRKEVNITSNTYDISYPFTKGMLPRDANFLDKAAYAFVGKNVSLDVHLSYELTSNLLHVSKSDVMYNKNTKTLQIVLDTPKLRTWLNTKETDMKTANAIFSGGYTDEERMRILDQAVEIGEKEVKSDSRRITDAKDDITEGLSTLLSSIDTVDNVKVTYKK